MPKRSLTQLFVDRIGSPKTGRVEYWDKHLDGFGLRISATGARSWIVMYRVSRKAGGDGRQVRETLGTVAKIPSVADARAKALASIEAARSGVNPVAERKAQTVLVEIEAKEAVEGTFAAVAERFLAEHVERNLRPKTIYERRRLVKTELLPAWGDRPIRTVARHDVTLLLDDKARTRPKAADEIRKMLRTMFKWAKDRDLVEDDPTNVSKRSKYVARDRALTDDEIRAFWAGCDRLGWPFGPAFKLLLLTAQRRQEVGAARWSEIDLEKRVWTIPAGRTKNGKAHIVHISDFALEVLEKVPRVGELLFASRGPAPSGYSKAKQRLDGLMGKAAGAEITSWVLHDLRRTAATGMAKLKIAPHVADRVLNHTAGTIRGVAAIYNKFQYEEERGAALEAWGRFVEGLVLPGNGNVVALRAGA